MFIYEAYKPEHIEYIKTFPMRRNIGGIFTDRWEIYNPIHKINVSEKVMKRFSNETECLKYCVQNGCQYRVIEVE